MGQVNLMASLGYSCPSSFKTDVRSHYALLLKQVTEMTLVSKPQTQLHISVQNKSLKKPGQSVNEVGGVVLLVFKKDTNKSDIMYVGYAYRTCINMEKEEIHIACPISAKEKVPSSKPRQILGCWHRLTWVESLKNKKLFQYVKFLL